MRQLPASWLAGFIVAALTGSGEDGIYITGLDIAEEMLNLAKQKAFERGIKVLWICWQ